MNTLRQPLFREATTALLVALLLLQSATAVAPGPAWWGTQNVTDPAAAPDDFAVANAGQLKHMARKAMQAMDAELPGGAGAAIHALVDPWGTTEETATKPDNGLAINQGQLKHVAAPFYDRLGLPYPWAGASAVTDNYALVNLGQLKHVFSFELKFRTFGGTSTAVTIPPAVLQAALTQWNALPVKPVGSSADLDGDGIPDDFDGDGIPNLQEYLMDPTKPLFDTDDYDGDRISNQDELDSGVLNMLNFADAVWDHEADGAVEYNDVNWNTQHYGDGVMNFEEMLLGLNLNATSTNTRTDGLTDAEVLVWTLNADAPLEPGADPLRTFWEGIDEGWLGTNVGLSHSESFAAWLDDADMNGNQIADGLEAFRAEVLDTLLWWPQNPGISEIEFPGLAYDQGTRIDRDGDGALDTDRDYDGLPDLWEYRYALNLRDDRDGWQAPWNDPDRDGLSNREEYAAGTNPRLADSDGDGFDDKLELNYGGDPLQAGVVPTVPLVLTIAGSSYQYIYPGQTTPALAVKATQDGQPVAGVTVTFTLTAGEGGLHSATALGVAGSQVSVVTGSNGMAAVTYAAGAQSGSASISASASGVVWSPSFGVNVVALPVIYGGGGAYGGPTTVLPLPPRSTASSAAGIAAASADGYRIRVLRRRGTDVDPVEAKTYTSMFPEYLRPYGLNPAALVGWQQPGFEANSWQHQTKFEFEPLPMQGPYRKPVVPVGVRRYLVLVYQGTNVEPGTPDAPKHAGVLTFQYSETGARVITLTGGIPDKFIKREGNESVTFEPPLATKAEERVWVRLLPVEVESRDRAVTGKIPHLGKMMGSKPFKIGFKAGSKELGTYDIPESGSPQGVTIYENADDEKTGIFGDDELADPAAAQAKLKTQEVVLAREGDAIRFYTVSDNISKFTVSLYLDGSKVADIDHELKRDDEFGDFIGTIEKFVAGDSPPGIGSGPTPIILAAAAPPQLTDSQAQQLLALVPVTLQERFPHRSSFTFTAHPETETPEEIAARTQVLETSYAEAFLVWLHEAKETLTEEQWTPVFTFLAGAGYNADAAMAPRLAGWNAGQPAAATDVLPESIRNRALVAKVLIAFLKNSVKIGVAGGKGYVYGLWDGLKADWQVIEGAVAMPGQLMDALLNPFTAAAELYRSFKALKDMTLEDWKQAALQMFSEFLVNQEARLDWPAPTNIEDLGVSLQAWSAYMAGYLYGFVAEQAVIIILTRGALTQIKAGKWFVTIIDKVKRAQRLFDALPPRASRLAALFPHAMASTATKQIMLRLFRAVPKKLRSKIIPDGRDYTNELGFDDDKARKRLRRAVNGVTNDGNQAHHIIPWEWKNEKIVKKASRAGFNINGGNNGILLKRAKHQELPGHPNYNKAVKQHLDHLWDEVKDLSDEEAASRLLECADWLRDAIEHAPNGLTENSTNDLSFYRFAEARLPSSDQSFTIYEMA